MPTLTLLVTICQQRTCQKGFYLLSTSQGWERDCLGDQHEVSAHEQEVVRGCEERQARGWPGGN